MDSAGAASTSVGSGTASGSLALVGALTETREGFGSALVSLGLVGALLESRGGLGAGGSGVGAGRAAEALLTC